MNRDIKAVEEGVGLATEAGSALDKIISNVNSLTEMIQHIATASEEQSATAGQISSDIESVATATEETASGARLVETAANELDLLAQNLKEMVSIFKVDKEGPEA